MTGMLRPAQRYADVMARVTAEIYRWIGYCERGSGLRILSGSRGRGEVGHGSLGSVFLLLLFVCLFVFWFCLPKNQMQISLSLSPSLSLLQQQQQRPLPPPPPPSLSLSWGEGYTEQFWLGVPTHYRAGVLPPSAHVSEWVSHPGLYTCTHLFLLLIE